MNSQRMENDHQAHEDFIYVFYSLLQAVRLHANNNEVVLDRFGNFLECVAQLTKDEDSLIIKVSSGHIIIQDEKLIYKKRTKNNVDNITHYFEQRNLEGLIFYDSVKEAPLDNVLTFIRALNAVGQEKSSLVSLAAELKNKIAWVKIVEKPEQAVDEKLSFEEEEDKKERAMKDYSHVLASFKEVVGKVMSQKRPGMWKTIRAVQTMVSHVLEDDKTYTAISTLRVFDDYTFTHSVNVAILSMCIGKRLGLSRRVLERLGLCGLLHDLGKIQVPKEILNKPGKLDDLELKFIEDHPLNSAKLIIKLRMSSDRKARILLPPFEHHMKYDLTGYPYANWRKPLSLFGRILSIVDVYDAITSPRVYRKSILS
ncbi:MAG: HD-GYP domain-containing protein, partial [Planctomycetota bacterium]